MLYGRTEAESIEILKGWERAIATGRLYGYGLSRRIFLLNPLPADQALDLQGVFDGNPALHNQIVMGYKILSPEMAGHIDGKIVVFPTGEGYGRIRSILEGGGLRENLDFVDADSFWSLFSFYKYGRLALNKTLTLFVTRRCTLRCRHCGVRIPYWPDPADVPLEMLIEEVNNFFRRIDCLRTLGITGGEPLLHPQLPEILDYIIKTHGHRIGRISINTNGTLRPTPALLDICKKSGIQLLISDYGRSGLVGYEAQFRACVEKAKEAGLEPVLAPKDMIWSLEYATSEMEKELAAFTEEEMKAHFARCRPGCQTFTQNRLYLCHRALSHEVIDGTCDRGRIDLEKRPGRPQLLMSLLGYTPQGYLDFCRKCPGRTFNNPIAAAEQIGRPA